MILDKKTKFIIGCVLVSIFIIFIAAIAIKLKIKARDTSYYLEIADVPGCAFEVVKDDNYEATAVMEISKHINFLDYVTYSYRNGEDTYLLFNMRKYIVAAKKGTTFNLTEDNLLQSLAKNSLNGIWFNAVNEAEYDKKRGVTSVEVNAQVSLTANLYEDFRGKLVTFIKDEEEWAMFVGVVDPRNEEMLKMVDYVADSFKPSKVVEQEEEYQISLADGTFTPITKDLEEALSDKLGKEDEKGDDDKLSTDSNIQEYAKITEDKAYTSSVYAMLPVGGIGYMELINNEKGGVEPCYVTVNKLYDADETREMVKAYCESGLAYYSSFTPPEGCHLEAVEISVQFTEEKESVVDVRLKGADGNNLKYRGLEYSPRTYEITTKSTKDNDWVTGKIYFFVIPNDCEEYAINIGGYGTEITKSAWFWIDKTK